MNQAGSKKRGCLRPLLIGIITITSLSFAIFYSVFLRGRYDGKKASFKAIVFQNVDVWQGPAQVLEDVTVVMEGQVISCVGKDCQVPANSKVYDGKGKSLIPGLIDMQVSFYALSAENQDKSPIETLIDYPRQRPEVRKHLHEAGITIIRSYGDPMANIRLLKKQIQDWEMAGPRVFAVGPLFTAKGGHPVSTLFQENPDMGEVYATQVADSNKGRQEVLDVIDTGMDGVKFVLDDFQGQLPTFSEDMLRALVSQAKRRKVWVSVRTGSNEEVAMAARAGADIIELIARDPLDSTTINLLVQDNIMVVPTLISTEIIPEDLEKSWYERPAARENLLKLSEAGVLLATGTATGKDVSFGASLHKEMELMVEAGLSPGKVLQAATQNPLYLFRLDDRLGQIKQDFDAEAILIKGRPWENIEDIRNVEVVVQDGRLIVENGKVLD